MDVVFIRHGRTEMNLKGLYGGINDISLSEDGIRDTENMARILQGKAFNRVYISPLRRTCDTAKILGFYGKLDYRIQEMNFGIFEGLSYQNILSKYPCEAKQWEKDYLRYRIPEGESLMDLYERVDRFLLDISTIEDTVLVISHEGVIKCALCSVFGNPEYFFKFKAVNTKFVQIGIQDGYKFIKSINSDQIY